MGIGDEMRNRWKDEVAFAHVVREAPRAYGERDVRRLCRAVIGLYDAIKAAPQAENAGTRQYPESASGPAVAAPTPRTDACHEAHGGDPDTAYHRLFHFARQLERELAVRNSEIEALIQSKNWGIEEINRLKIRLAAKQAKIDRLMIEHCPEEMTDEQRAEWARHQKPAPVDDQYENGGHDPYIDPAYG